MPSITALNVRLGIDVSNFSEGVNLAQNEVRAVSAVMRQSVPATEKFQQELARLDKAFSDAGKQSTQYANAVEFLNKKYQQGAYSADAVKKATDALAATEKIAADAAKRLKDETARLAEAEKQHNAVMDKGKAVTQSAATASEAYSRKIRELQALLRAGAISQETYRRSVEQTTKAMRDTSSSSNSAMSSIKGLAAAYLTVQTVSKAISLASQVEDATIAFEVLTGSAKDGAIIFEQIRKFAAESPITFGGATEAAKTMMSFGIAAQDVQKNLQMLSDVTGGNNDRFKMLSLAFSQMSAAGRLMGQDLLQMVNAGFNPLQQISKTTGESLIELKKRMEDGGISTDEVRRAFQDATAEGGMFHGMTERLSETVSGKMNIALSDMEQMLAKVGEELGPLVIQLLGAANDMKPAFEIVLWVIRKISEGLAFTIAVWTDLINSVSNFEIDTTATDKFLDDYEKRNRERAEAENKQVQDILEEKIVGINIVAKAEREAAKKTEEEHKKGIEKTLRETDELVRKARQDAENAEKDWQRELTDARKAAMDFFEERQKQNEQRRADVAKGPGAGMEVGSSEAVKFAADVVNASIAGAAVPNDPAATNREIAAKTAELLIAQREANARADRQIQLAERQLKEMENNGFRRLR
tara:strand:- start:140 stop:2068 length:1929 start_codon:yes stop_codon:yes gene_type:complete